MARVNELGLAEDILYDYWVEFLEIVSHRR